MIEHLLPKFYSVMLRLYPRQFRHDFETEMQTVFGDALGSARQQGKLAVLRLFGREARELPRALTREHWQAVREGEGAMVKPIHSVPGVSENNPEFVETHPRGWGEIFLAMSFFIYLLLIDLVLKLLFESGLFTWGDSGIKVMNISLAVLLIGAILVVFFLSWRRNWPAWSTTWFLSFVTAPLMVVVWLSSLLFKNGFIISQSLAFYFIYPVIVAVVLYTVTRRTPLHGLLASLPLLYLFWMVNNEEFVPDPIETSVEVTSMILICLVIAYLLRRGNWRTGLIAVLATNLVVGFLFSYAGIYHGGTLPFTAPGPSLVEVVRSLIPQYLAIGAILLGPLFAWNIRQAGRSTGWIGRAGYHLALAGLLLVILANLIGLEVGKDDLPRSIKETLHSFLAITVVLGLGAYLLGLCFSLWYRIIYLKRNISLPREILRGTLLALLPLGIPITLALPFFTWTRPISVLYGIPFLWKLPHDLTLSIGLVWLFLSAWVVILKADGIKPAARLGEITEATQVC
jgi:hypothetical protein